jgi:hypothetical protein
VGALLFSELRGQRHTAETAKAKAGRLCALILAISEDDQPVAHHAHRQRIKLMV